MSPSRLAGERFDCSPTLTPPVPWQLAQVAARLRAEFRIAAPVRAASASRPGVAATREQRRDALHERLLRDRRGDARAYGCRLHTRRASLHASRCNVRTVDGRVSQSRGSDRIAASLHDEIGNDFETGGTDRIDGCVRSMGAIGHRSTVISSCINRLHAIVRSPLAQPTLAATQQRTMRHTIGGCFHQRGNDFLTILIYRCNFYIAMREIRLQPRGNFAKLKHQSRAAVGRASATGCMKGLDHHPIHARPTGRAILAGPCSEAIGGWARLVLRAAGTCARRQSRRASADQGSGRLGTSGLATTH